MPVSTDLRFENALSELSRRRASLRNGFTAAMHLAANVVLEQRPPFCCLFLHVHRLLLQLSDEVMSYFEMEEALLPPRPGHERPYPAGGRIALAMLRSGQSALSALFADMCEATQGFHQAREAGGSYRALVDLLREIQEEITLQFRLEEEEVFPKLTAGFAQPLKADSPSAWMILPPAPADARKQSEPN